MRVDVMSKMRGVDSFAKLWKRRTTLQIPGGEKCDLLSLPDLVQAKKTQRDKDWPMIRRLVEASFFENRRKPSATQIRFWLAELRTQELLIEVAGRHPAVAKKLISQRPLLRLTLTGELKKLEKALAVEEQAEREIDRRYWQPLKNDLEKLRHGG